MTRKHGGSPPPKKEEVRIEYTHPHTYTLTPTHPHKKHVIDVHTHYMSKSPVKQAHLGYEVGQTQPWRCQHVDTQVQATRRVHLVVGAESPRSERHGCALAQVQLHN